MGGVFAFLGGSAFRMIWGELSAAWTKHQDHKQELQLLERQERADAAAHTRNLEALRVQHDLGIKVIEANVVAHANNVETDAWATAVDAASGKYKSGVAWVDGWNQGIRPAGATLALLMILAEVVALGFMIPEGTVSVLYAFLGLYVADRSLKHRGK